MKILLVSGHYYPHLFGGTENVVQTLAEALVVRGHDVAVATLTPNRLMQSDQINGVKVYYLPLRNVYFPGPPIRRSSAAKALWHTIDVYNPLMSTALAHVLQREKPDVVNTHNVGGFSVAAWQTITARGIPLINTAHGINLLCSRYMVRREGMCRTRCRTCRVYTWPKKRLSRHVDVFTGVSRYIVDTYSAHRMFPNAEKLVIHNSCTVSRDVVGLSSSDHSSLRVVFLGRLHWSKGLDLLIRSFLELPEGRAELIIAGTGEPEYERQLRAAVGSRKDVHWLGFVSPDVALQGAHITVVPSVVNDSAPLVVLESMARGVPVMGSRRGGIPELIGEDAGWTFDPDYPTTLTDKLRFALESRARLIQMSECALSRARAFSVDNMVDGYLGAYLRARERRGGYRPTYVNV